MSIFIANMAFRHYDPETIVLAKVGILSGSAIAALLSDLLLRAILPQTVPQGGGVSAGRGLTDEGNTRALLANGGEGI